MAPPTLRIPPDLQHGKTPPLMRVAGWGLAIATAAALGVALAVLIQAPAAGLDLTDEGLYLLSADNRQPFAGHNGWFGRYTGLLFGAVGWDIGWFRVAGVVILVAAGLVLGLAIVRWATGDRAAQPPSSLRLAIVLGTSAAALVNYSLFIRSPGYNWLAFVGVALAVAGILVTLTLERQYGREAIVAGLLIALGCVLGLWGRAAAGIGVAALAAVAIAAPGVAERAARMSAGIVAIAGAAVLLALHFLFIADPATTIDLFVRSSRMVAVMDPKHAVDGASIEMLGDLAAAPGEVLRATSGLVLIGLAPFGLAALGRPRGSVTTGVAVAAPVLVVAAALLVGGQWLGGAAGYTSVAIADLAVLATAAIAAVSALIVARREPRDAGIERRRRLAYGVVVLLGATVAYAFGSGNGFVAQTNGAAVLVLVAAAGLIAIPLPRREAAIAFSVWALGVALIALVVLASGRADPYRMAPLDSATETVPFGRHARPLVVDPAAATYWRELVDDARAACWNPGTRLLDLTWSPADAYALDATVPETIIPLAGHFATGTASALEALRVSGPALWADAWLLTSPDLPQIDAAAVVALAGRSFPSDYDLVASLTAPGLGFRQELWRPADAGPCPGGAG